MCVLGSSSHARYQTHHVTNHIFLTDTFHISTLNRVPMFKRRLSGLDLMAMLAHEQKINMLCPKVYSSQAGAGKPGSVILLGLLPP